MSELKVFYSPDWEHTKPYYLKWEHTKSYYLKSEADKVIRHQKYKRCLAMARWCASRSASWCLDPADEQLHKSDFYDKWKFRWRKLAEKFKEANNAST